MTLTEQQLLRILPNAGQKAGVFVPALNRAMIRFSITSNVRMAAFLAQAGHESAQLTRLVENLNYGAQGLANTWPSRYAENPKAAVKVPNAIANQIARNPPLIANTTYAGRNGNGPASSGDGWLYRGRGLIMVTGRANYRAAGVGIGQPLEDQPELLEQADFAAMSAAWWWSANGLNELADAGRFEDITRRINGGLNGLAERQKLWEKAKAVLV